MLILQGKYNKARVFTDNIEEGAISQIIELCNQEFASGSKIRIMPDVHAGAGCTIGTTMTITDKVVPNLVGVDIGCGMFCLKLKNKNIDFLKLDTIIEKYIPSGFNIRRKEHEFVKNIELDNLKCSKFINLDRATKSCGTLGGGNHFLEVDKDSESNLYLVIHTGSRYLGKQVAEHYQNLAIKTLTDRKEEKQVLINKLKNEGRDSDIQGELIKMKKPKIANHLAYLEGENLRDYLHDINITQQYATENRRAIANEIIKYMDLDIEESFTTIHNYIDIKNNILRKGAISAQLGEKVIIPINMADGSLICVGKGNSEWNSSAPHGAGRIMSRGQSKENISIDEFKNRMKGIWSSSVCESTIDESPMAYKPMEEIVQNIKNTVDIIDTIKPVYNYKAH